MPISKEGAADTLTTNITLDELTISASRKQSENGVITKKFYSDDIERNIGASLASILRQTGGVSSVSTGAIISKPVIHGMTGNRVVIVDNGVVGAYQQWGMDHAPGIDANNNSSIEVVKGSNQVRYGSNALGGIVVFHPRPLPYGVQRPVASLTTMYATNGRRQLLTGYIESSFSHLPQLAWNLSGTMQSSGDRRTAHYLLNNTGTRMLDVKASVGWKYKNLSSELRYTLNKNKIGIMFGSMMGNSQILRQRIKLGRPLYTEPFSRKIDSPYQDVDHHTLQLKTTFTTEQSGVLAFRMSLQKDMRDEYHRRRLSSNMPAVSLRLTSLQTSSSWIFHFKKWLTESGIQTTYEENHSRSGTGFTPIIPNYTLMRTGAYMTAKRKFSRISVESGLRYDYEKQKAEGYDWTGNKYGGNRQFHNLSYNFGLQAELSQSLRQIANLGITRRSPHVSELYSDGSQMESGMYIKGDSEMNSETGIKLISGLQYKRKALEIDAEIYAQYLNNYIYDKPTGREIVLISGAYPEFQYLQTNAGLMGLDIEFRANIPRIPTYLIALSTIRAYDISNNRNLPYIPPLRINQELSWYKVYDKFCISLAIRHQITLRQKHYDSESDLTAKPPPGYALWGADASIVYKMRKAEYTMRLTIDNMFNKEYKDYTNRARYYAHEQGRDIRLSFNIKI